MGTNIREFSKQLGKMHSEIRDAVADIIKDAVGSGYENTLRSKAAGGSPKKTGWLRANTYITMDTPITDTTGDKKNVSTSRRDRLYKSFMNKSTDKVLKTPRMYITYTVPYAVAVNDGTSKQQGQHFKERAVQDITQTFMRKRGIK